MYAVFDGHGGREVAAFCEKHMPRELLTLAQQSQVGTAAVLPWEKDEHQKVKMGFRWDLSSSSSSPWLLLLLLLLLWIVNCDLWFILYDLWWKMKASYGFTFGLIWDKSHEAPNIGDSTIKVMIKSRYYSYYYYQAININKNGVLPPTIWIFTSKNVISISKNRDFTTSKIGDSTTSNWWFTHQNLDLTIHMMSIFTIKDW